MHAEALIVGFEEIGIADRPSVGGKGASLGELARVGVPVPPGFVVTTAAFEAFLAVMDPRGTIRASVSALDPQDLDAVTAITAKIRKRIDRASLPEDLERALAEAYERLCGRERKAPVAVRSSATSEDSEEASFAGLQDTYLWVCGRKDVARDLRKCWASLYNVESVTYRRRLGLPEEGLAMGVVVQRMVDAKCAGVMFTLSPNTGDRSVITIEGSWGLGSSLVSGEVTPDRFVVNKVTGELTGRSISTKTIRHVPRRRGGVNTEAVPESLRTASCVSDEEISALAEMARGVERHYGTPQDIEWAIAGNGTVFLLQSRPETVWSSREAKPIAAPKDEAAGHVFDLLGGNRIGRPEGEAQDADE